jgi:hypothetical protein
MTACAPVLTVRPVRPESTLQQRPAGAARAAPDAGADANGAGQAPDFQKAGRRRVRAYSRAVAWMKVLLPLAAVAVMAALFFSAQKSGWTLVRTSLV